MTTSHRIALAFTLLLSAVAASAQPVGAKTFALRQTRTLGHPAAVVPAYGWPVKPFGVQHPVRAFLDDPRIGHEGGKAFHFGIDVAAPDGTPVYAVTGGVVYLSHGSVAVVAAPEHVFGYWHIRRDPTLVNHQGVQRHRLLGWIETGWGHVHFAERIHGVYVNPLRSGGLGPYSDPIAPSVDSVSVVHLRGAFAVIARAHDTTWPPVPGPWANEPVTPALLKWRVGTAGPWRVAADFRQRMLDRGTFGSVYAPETRQNHQGRPGTFAFFLSHDWRPADGTYRIQVAASDTRGNRSVGSVEITFLHGEVQ